MTTVKITPPATGEKITIRNGKLAVPDHPIIPFIEGDGTGADIWRASVRVLDAAVDKAYGGKRRISWMEVYAGEKANNLMNTWLPEETVAACREYLVSIKGPLTTPIGGGIRSLNVALRQMLDLYVCLRPVRWFVGVPSPVRAPEKVDMVIFRENTEDIYAGIEFERGDPKTLKLIDTIESLLDSGVSYVIIGTAAVKTPGFLHDACTAFAGHVMVALDAKDGTVRWRARVSSEVLAAPAVGDGLAIVRSADSRVFAFSAADGKRRWVYQRAPAALVVRSPAGVTLLRGLALAGFAGGKLVAISTSNGGVRWEASVSLPHGSTELERVTDVVGNPAVLGPAVCAAAFQGRVSCFEIRSGNPIWSRKVSSVTGVSLDARHAYVSDDQGAVHALDRYSGRSVWKQDQLVHRQLSLPYPAGSAIAVGDFEGYVHFLARDSGAFVARIATDGGAVRAAPIRLPNGFLVQTHNGGLIALSL